MTTNTETDAKTLLNDHVQKIAKDQVIIRPEWTNRDDAIALSIQPDLVPRGSFQYKSLEEAQGSPLAEEVLKIPGITSLAFNPRSITLGLDENDEENKWTAPNAAIEVIKNFVTQAKPVITVEEFEKIAATKTMTDEEKKRLTKNIQELFDKEINPALASHGGMVRLLNLEDYVAYVEVGGGCQGCHSIDATIKQGIEVRVREVFPEIIQLVDTTDHAAGTNPYYTG